MAEQATYTAETRSPNRSSLAQKASRLFVGDTTIWVILLGLMIGSMVVVFSAISQEAFAAEMYGRAFYGEFMKHMLLIVVSFILVSAMARVPTRYYRWLSGAMMIAAILLLAWTLVGGTELNEGKRWIQIGGFTLQPSEFAKVAIVNYVASCLRGKNGEHASVETFVRIWGPVLLVIGLIFFENISTAAFIFAMVYILCFIGGANSKWMLYILGFGVVAMLIFLGAHALMPKNAEIGRSATGQNRISRFMDKAFKPIDENTYDDIMGMDYQVVSAQKAIANSGVTGVGAGQSELRQFLPAAFSDYIYNVVVEEYGLFGSLFLIFMYIMFFWRCGQLARQSRSMYKSLLLMGVGLIITSQAVMNMMVAANLLPVTGQTLPFISKGGSSYLFMSMLFGMALSVSREIKDANLKRDAAASDIEGMPEVEMERIPEMDDPESSYDEL